MKEDLITIIVPIYNAERFLDNCISSIIRQNYKNIEILLVVDGSPDRSIEICKKYKKNDKRISIIEKKNGGVSSARNIGIKNSKGKYILFVDSDDTLSESAISLLYNTINEGYDFVIGNYFIPQQERYGNVIEKEFNYNKIFQCKVYNRKCYDLNDKVGNTRTVWGKIYKSSIIKSNNILFDENIKLFEDGIFNIEYLSYVNKIKESGFDGVLINITNPCDIVTRELAINLNLPKGRIFGTGTGLDTSRLLSALARQTPQNST